MTRFLTRRHMLASAAVSTLALALSGPAARAAEEAILLTWGDLIPGDGAARRQYRELSVVQHGQLTPRDDQDLDSEVTTEFDGKLVALPGFALPLELSDAVREFILVPYVGACIHVPPPPPNQLVIVQSEIAYHPDDLWEPVLVTGAFHTAAISTELADIGYTLQAEKVEYFDVQW